MTIHIVIPARYNSSRLPAKPLKLIAGTSMIERVYQQAQKADINSIHVATDDQRILEAVHTFSGQAIMTREDHISGTDRLAEVAELMQWDDDDIVINLQGDEPMMPPEVIQFIAKLASETDAGISTLASPINSFADIFNPHIVKVVMDATGKAQYFSRAPIPWDRDSFSFTTYDIHDDTQEKQSRTPHYRHLGMYAYRVKTLKQIPTLPPCEQEQLESLEQLRPLYNGIAIQVGIIQNPPEHGVDTEADLQRVELAIIANNKLTAS